MTTVYGSIIKANIERSTLDTDDIILNMSYKKSPIDVAGWTANLTINADKNATDASTNVFNADGVAMTPTTDGKIRIDMSNFGIVPAGKYEYDIRVIDANGRGRESMAGKFTVTQRIPRN